MTAVPSIRLNNGVEIPQFGFGVWQVDPAEAETAVSTALEAGYRHVDTAQMYRNEEGVGRAIASSGVARDELFVTTKLDNDRHGDEEPVKALEESLQRLGLDHVDLYLIHWPRPKADRYVETWKAFERILADGKARAIGVSNFQIPHLERLAAETGTVPAVNQIELHPYNVQQDVRAYNRENAIATEAWSPIGQGKDLLGDGRLVQLAEKYGKTPAQVVLRWHVQLGNIVFPKSVTPSRIRENIEIFDFQLDPDDVAAITGLNRDERLGPDPDTLN